MRRVLLKLSGQALCQDGASGIDAAKVGALAREIVGGLSVGDIELACVIGGGNFLRGQQIAAHGIDRVTGDNMGMLATIMNALAVQSALESLGLPTRVLSAIHVNDVAEPFIRRRAVRHLEKKRVILLAGGTGHPYFTTDTTASLRALQIGATHLFKGTKVKGVYSADPEKDKDAVYYPRLSFQKVLEDRLKFMDSTAASLCMDNKLPVRVFKATDPGNVERALRGEDLGTLVE